MYIYDNVQLYSIAEKIPQKLTDFLSGKTLYRYNCCHEILVYTKTCIFQLFI